MLLKNTQLKYNVLELIASDNKCSYIKLIGVETKKQALLHYGDAEVLSVKDFDDTKTTSVILADDESYKGVIIKCRG